MLQPSGISNVNWMVGFAEKDLGVKQIGDQLGYQE